MTLKIVLIAMLISGLGIAGDPFPSEVPIPRFIKRIQKSPHVAKVKSDTTSHGQKIVSLLIEGLLDADPDSTEEWFFLETEQTLKVYQEFARSFQMINYSDPEKPWSTHLDSLSAIAEILFKSSLKFLIDELQFEAALKMSSELKLRQKSEQCNYEWFLSFTERLEFLLTNREQLNLAKHAFNPPFDKYQEKLRLSNNVEDPDWWSHESYLEASRTAGNLHTQKIASLESRVKEFPFLVYLPLPLELNPKYIFKNIPSLNQALAFKNISPIMKWSQGGFLPPYLQGCQSQQHWARLREMLSSTAFLAPDTDIGFKKIASSEFAELVWQLVLVQRQLYFKSYDIVNRMIENREANPFINIHTRKMDYFFAFYIFYYSSSGIYNLISLLQDASKILFLKEGMKMNHMQLKKLRDPHYFNNGLAGDLKASPSEKQMAFEFLHYAQLFSKDFNLFTARDKEYINLFNEYNLLLHKMISQDIEPTFSLINPLLYRESEPEIFTINNISWHKFADLPRRTTSCILQFVFDDKDWTNHMPKPKAPHVIEVQIPSRFRKEAKIARILHYLDGTPADAD